MSIVIDDLDLIKRVQDGILEEIRNISYINIIDRRNIVELEIPGSQGNVIQDMGFEAIKVELFGDIIGQNARTSIESLRDKYESNKPISFSSDITSIAEIINVIIEYLYIEEVGGSPFRYKYYISLREYNEPSTDEAQQIQEKAKQPLAKAEDITKQQLGKVEDITKQQLGKAGEEAKKIQEEAKQQLGKAGEEAKQQLGKLKIW